MAKSMHYVNCIGAIRHTTYGRDNRKPIADAIEEVKKQGYVAKMVSNVDEIECINLEENDFRLDIGLTN